MNNFNNKVSSKNMQTVMSEHSSDSDQESTIERKNRKLELPQMQLTSSASEVRDELHGTATLKKALFKEDDYFSPILVEKQSTIYNLDYEMAIQHASSTL